jgi:predicted ATPase
VAHERLAALRRDETEKKSRNPFLEPVEDKARARERIHLRAESQAHPTYHELGLGHTLVSTPLYEPHYPHVTALREQLAGWQVYNLDSEAMLSRDIPPSPVTWIGRRGENLAAFLSTLQRGSPKAFETFQRSLNLVLPHGRGIDVEQGDDGRLMLRLWEDEFSYPGLLASGGTLNMVGLLAAVFPAAAGTVVACEEPEAGVHPARLKIVAELLRQASRAGARQVLATTHSPILADHFQDQELFVCKKEEGQSIIAGFEKVDPMMRRSTIVRALQKTPQRKRAGA